MQKSFCPSLVLSLLTHGALLWFLLAPARPSSHLAVQVYVAESAPKNVPQKRLPVSTLPSSRASESPASREVPSAEAVADSSQPQLPSSGTPALAAPPLSALKQKPRYTPRALALGIEGSVILSLEVSREGKVTGARVQKSLGYGLDEEALAAAKAFLFTPARDQSGEAVATMLVHEIRFELD